MTCDRGQAGVEGAEAGASGTCAGVVDVDGMTVFAVESCKPSTLARMADGVTGAVLPPGVDNKGIVGYNGCVLARTCCGNAAAVTAERLRRGVSGAFARVREVDGRGLGDGGCDIWIEGPEREVSGYLEAGRSGWLGVGKAADVG